jgi:hypothetical protein
VTHHRAGGELTTYSGHRAGFTSWWAPRATVNSTRNGHTDGAVDSEPRNLFDGGTASPMAAARRSR